jgi:hypothetical protein
MTRLNFPQQALVGSVVKIQRLIQKKVLQVALACSTAIIVSDQAFGPHEMFCELEH